MAATVERSERRGDRLWWWCPGCQCHHAVPVVGDRHSWTWNGSTTSPTLNPSVRCNSGPGRQCHFWLRNGRIEFLADCDHELAGQTVQLEPVSDW